jgi:hypothetical protein
LTKRNSDGRTNLSDASRTLEKVMRKLKHGKVNEKRGPFDPRLKVD